MPTAIEFNNISKLYRLGQVSSGTLVEDLNRWWTTRILRKEDPLLTVGETNIRDAKGTGDFIWALENISFKVEQGDVVGIIGGNGAGKSTLLKILSKITAPTTGTIKARGRVGSLLEVGTGFHSEMTGRENIYLNGAILGMSKSEMEKRLDEIVDFSGCERFIDTPIKRYSSGMKMRLGFAVAANLDPEILVVDEVLAVGDIEFREKAIGKMRELSQNEGRTVLFVSHNLMNLSKLCKIGIVLNNGRMDYLGTIGGAIDKYLMATRGEELRKDFPQGRKRRGDGTLRFRSIRFFSKSGSERNVFEVGEECIVRINFDATEKLRNSRRSKISFLVNSSDGQAVAWLNTSMFTDRIDAGSSMIQFRISKLMLTEGTYSVKLYAEVDGKVADEVFDAVHFEVVYQDYFGTGRKPLRDSNIVGYTFLDYQIAWE